MNKLANGGGLAELSIRRPVLTIVLSILILLAGLLSIGKLGVREYPAIGDVVELLGRDHLQLIYSSFDGRPMQIGDVQEDGGLPALIDADGLVAKHFAVLGSTGVGKSSGNRNLDRAALDAAKRSKYNAGVNGDGQRVGATVSVDYEFAPE